MNIKKFITTFLITTALLLILVILVGGAFIYWGNLGGGVQLDILDEYTKGGVKNVLVLGTDASGLRSDVIMICSVNPKKDQINIISIPRDTKVNINGKDMKINAALALGGEELTIQKVKEISRIPIHDYVTFNFNAVKDIVNALDGVTFNVPRNMDYEDPEQGLYIHLQKGKQTLDGNQALQLLRYRSYEMGDITRNSVQQDFVKALFEQKANLSYFSKIPEIYGIVNDNIVSSMNLAEITRYATEIKNMSTVEMNNYEMPFVISGSYVLVDNPAAQEIFDEHFKDETPEN